MIFAAAGFWQFVVDNLPSIATAIAAIWGAWQAYQAKTLSATGNQIAADTRFATRVNTSTLNKVHGAIEQVRTAARAPTLTISDRTNAPPVNAPPRREIYP